MFRGILFAALAALFFPLASANAATALWFKSDAGDSVGQGATQLFQSPSAAFVVSVDATNEITVTVNGTAAVFDFKPDTGTLAPGAYETLDRYFNSPGRSTLKFSNSGRQCFDVRGRVSVLQASFDSLHRIVSFAADFEQYCDRATAGLVGEVRINSAIPLTIDKPPGSTTPDPFAFTPRTLLPPGSQATSNVTGIVGINAPAPISISGGEYSINGGPFVSTSGVVGNRDHVQVRAVASTTPGATTSAVLDVGGVVGTFAIRTYLLGEVITGLWYDSSPGDYVGQGLSELFLPPEWKITSYTTGPGYYSTEVGLHVLIQGPRGRNWGLDIYAGAGRTFAAGPYESADAAFLVSPSVELSGDNRGCNTIAGRFVILEYEAAPGGGIGRLAMNFEQHCGGEGPPLYGEMRINSTVPFTYLEPPGSTIPDPFALESQRVVPAGSLVTSGSATIYGVTGPAPISIAGGRYSVNGSAYTSAPGTVNNRDHVTVRLEASRTAGATTEATLTVGGVSATLSARTYQLGMVMSGLYYHQRPGPFGPGFTHTYLAPPGILRALPFASSGVDIHLDGEHDESWNLRLTPPTGTDFAPGIYEGVHNQAGPGFAGLDFFNCSQSTSRFVLYEFVRNPDQSLERIAIDFEQHCENHSPALYVQLRINSTVPLSSLVASTGRRFDINGDGKSDILFRNGDGTNYVWHMDGAFLSGGRVAIASQGPLPSVDPSWFVAGLGDFNGDGNADILWRNVSGANYVWHLDGSTISDGSLTIVSHGLLPSVDTSWSVAGIGDFNGDGKADILWRHSSGANYIWHLDGGTISGGVVAISSQGLLPGVTNEWSVAGIGDFNGDGKSDILWRRTDGANYVWHIDGASIVGGVVSIASQGLLPSADTSWSVVATGDYNGDGMSDIFFRRGDGTNYIWHVNGAVINSGMLQIVSQGLLPGLDTSWTLVGQGDYNGDGKSDVFWRRSDGTNYVWHIDGSVINAGVLSIPSAGALPAVDTSWTVQNPK